MLNRLKSFSAQFADRKGLADGIVYCKLNDLLAFKWQVQALKLPKSKRISRPQTGSHLSRFRGRGMEFSEVRVYQPGDDVRSIDWRVTARRQTPHTKLFNEERERPLFILCDQSQSQFFGSQHAFKSVKAAEVAALFAWAGLQNNDRIGGIVFSDHGHHEIKPARNRKNVLRLLTLVKDFNHALSVDMPQADPAFKLDDALNETVRLAKPGTLITIVSDFLSLSAQTEKLLAKLSQHSELILIHCFDPLEQMFAHQGTFPISDGNETIILDTHGNDVRQTFSNQALAKQDQLKQLAVRVRAPLIDLSTHDQTLYKIQNMLFSMQR